MRRLLDLLFPHEEINGGGRCPTYLHRWTLLQPRRPRRLWRGFGVYLRQFVGDDWSLDLHDHPKRFVSIGLWGSYVEHTPSGYSFAGTGREAPLLYDCGCSHLKVAAGLCSIYSDVRRLFVAPWIRTFPASHIHRITLAQDRRPCWTLVVVLRSSRDWGFWHRGRFIHWRDYVKGGSSWIADKMKACP